MLMRRGTSLAEVLVALTLSALILAWATGTLLRHGRTSAAAVVAGRGAAQLRAGVALLPAQLGLLAPSADDIAPGEARDTALQLRTAVATGVACDRGATVSIAAGSDSALATGMASMPRPGDSLWWYLPDSARWRGAVLSDVWSDSLRCASPGAADVMAVAARVISLRTSTTDTIPAYAPLRITRQERLSIYRAGDGSWQLGLREWSDVTHSFAAVQPVAGPFQRAAPDGSRTGFRYFDSSGAELSPSDDPIACSRIARIRIIALGIPEAAIATHDARATRDSADVAVRPASGGP